jgi:hypothetical protein
VFVSPELLRVDAAAIRHHAGGVVLCAMVVHERRSDDTFNVDAEISRVAKSVQYLAVDDYEYCSSLSERLGHFAGSRIDGIPEIDSRLLLILHHTTRQPDTLSFNRQLMTHNGIVYHVDSSMLRVAITVLPEGEKRTILKDLDQ